MVITNNHTAARFRRHCQIRGELPKAVIVLGGCGVAECAGAEQAMLGIAGEGYKSPALVNSLSAS